MDPAVHRKAAVGECPGRHANWQYLVRLAARKEDQGIPLWLQYQVGRRKPAIDLASQANAELASGKAARLAVQKVHK